MGEDVGISISRVEVWRNGEVMEINRDECEFEYRDSQFKKNRDVILRVWIELRPGYKSEIMATMQKHMNQRMGRIPPYPSPGSFFKNIKTDHWDEKNGRLEDIFKKRGKIPAAWLIDQAGGKGLRRGDAAVSDMHSNIIVNMGQATAADVLSLVDEIKERVYNKFGIALEPEVEMV
jgi:UDP-N-acetylmuramate dehydrogenase